ncbi:YdcF family protein [Alteromonas sp. Cnat3-28]|uniref:YdcF family protein n=1 Tax=Alteromonas sp. Cnat3-28 TaxID=2917729 RepID=UPI001EF4C468|nr:YdcF family protein [Alteromonas sp. Cnat3-28]MCG7644882.1 YdcF family protein [Alteromonas sp. Cnat3-28]
MLSYLANFLSSATVILSLLFAASVIHVYKTRKIKVLLISTLFFFIATQQLIANLIIFPLEHGVLSGQKMQGKMLHKYEYIGVLGCNYREFKALPELDRWPRCSLLRLLTAESLIKTTPHLKIILSAGDFGNWGESFAHKSAKFLVNRGVPADKIRIVPHGFDTESEIAAVATFLGNKKQIALITSASHQYRAQLYFSNHGIDAVGIPTDFFSNGELTIEVTRPDMSALLAINRALHEYLGIIEVIAF